MFKLIFFFSTVSVSVGEEVTPLPGNFCLFLSTKTIRSLLILLFPFH